MPDYKNPDVSLGFLREQLAKYPESAIKVIADPIEDGVWNVEGEVFCINGTMLEDGKLILIASSSKNPWTAARLLEELELAAVGFPDTTTMYCLYRKEIKRIDELYGHSTYREKWTGLPIDIVLGLDL